MKMMKRISIYSLLLTLASCSSVEPTDLDLPVDSDSPKIVVCGGSSGAGSTRADDFKEPDNLGVCNADKIRILTFKGTTIEGVGGTMSAGEMDFFHQDEINIPNNLNYRDKWTTHLMNLILDGSKANWFAFPAIAYSSDDEHKFSLENASYAGLKLKILTTNTNPELYFGRLLPANKDYKFNNTLESNKSHEAESMMYKNSNKVSWETEPDNPQLEGKLYRIVSQLNINIFEMSSNVEKIEMYLSNVPTTIGLYAKHRTALGQEGNDRGFFYPIVEATGDDQHSENETLVCTVTNEDYADGTAKLSTFILPSAEGRTVTVKAYFKTPIDENGNKTVSRTLRASQNYYLTEETSKVYFSSEKLLVYDAVSNKFMSYPNVRVNVSGKLSDIFSEESESNVEIEICPNYDGQHKIEI